MAQEPAASRDGMMRELKALRVHDTPDGQETFRIAELSQEFGITARTIRFYESQGLLTPIRDGQNRIYSRQDRAKLAWILRGKRVGFSLTDIKEMLDLYGAGDGRMKQRAVTLSKCRQRISDLQSQRADIDATIQELQTFCITLENLVMEQDNTRSHSPWADDEGQ
ncbi:MAG: MerR family DNA-binding transcriptional regulator [Pseudomonadota bacterium]